jgi:eukaryotic-like serine/threonine-protein kinase
MELALGQTIGPYRLIRKLGEGTTSRVFEVEHLRIGRRAAMKIAHTDAALPGISGRLFAEARAVNLINHPNIVAITEIIEPTEQHPAFALVMELLEGELLADVMTGKGRLPPARFLPILAQVCDGLAAVHAAGFVHRDLKPENICLVEQDGRRDRVKLLDFGLVKALRPDVTSPTATCEGTFMGSPAYSSPEQAQGKPVDQRTDIYAVGIMVHELVTGRLPFEAQGIADLLMKQITVAPPRLPAEMLATDIGLALDAIIQTCLAKDPAERSLTAGQLAEMFRRIEAGERVTPPRRRGSLGRGARSPRRRAFALAGAAALAVAAAMLIGIGAGTGTGTGTGTHIGSSSGQSARRPVAVSNASAASETPTAPPAAAGVAAVAAAVAGESPARSRPAPDARRWARPARGPINKARTLDPYR